MIRIFSRPRRSHVFPAFADRKMPHPMEMWLRMNVSPVPAQTMLGSEGASAKAPIEATGCSSKIGFQWTPPSVVFQIPPEAAPVHCRRGCIYASILSYLRSSWFANHVYPAILVTSKSIGIQFHRIGAGQFYAIPCFTGSLMYPDVPNFVGFYPSGQYQFLLSI